jgi:RNA-directed DNA polymerase
LAVRSIGKLFLQPEEMAPGPWPVPVLPHRAALAEFLRMSAAELAWFADLAGRNGRDREPKLQHYTVRWLAKPNGSARPLEIPKDRLKIAQRQILDTILSHIPVHPAAHGFVAGRSILSAAAPHVGREVVLKFDLADFFASVNRARIRAIFSTAGYPEAVAQLLAGLCTTRLTAGDWQRRPHPGPHDHARWQKLAQPHLPQGAPTSPAIANLAAYGLDCRLQVYSQACGATYTRYADDLTLSGPADLAHDWRGIRNGIARIAWEEGFDLNFRKIRVQRAGTAQHVLGLMVNEKLNVPRLEYDRLKAILTNCVRTGPEQQNRDRLADFRGHLLGRIAFVSQVHPQHGAKLKSLLDDVIWKEVSG